MFRRLRETGPGLLVPLAWTFAAAAHEGLVATRTVSIAHVVMCVLLAAFAVTSWRDMREGVLHAWLWVIVVGFGVTLLGAVSFLASDAFAADTLAAMRATTVAGWMALPAVALAYTGHETPAGERGWVYTAGGVCSALGLAVYLGGPVVAPASAARLLGLGLAGLGQTAGILLAVAES